MRDVLAEIVAYKHEVVAERQSECSLEALQEAIAKMPPTKGFVHSMKSQIAHGHVALIAELKKASPSKGIIREDFAPLELAEAYLQSGATCLSILTDERYFQGKDHYVREVAAHSPLPILRKDFMVDPYQIFESRALGADCVLLIMAALGDHQAKTLEQTAYALGMDVLAETHNEEELDRALSMLDTPLIGINNRNLKTLEVDINTTIALRHKVPDECVVVCESGIATHQDVQQMRDHAVHAFLVGESLMKQTDVAAATRALLGEK